MPAKLHLGLFLFRDLQLRTEPDDLEWSGNEKDVKSVQRVNNSKMTIIMSSIFLVDEVCCVCPIYHLNVEEQRQSTAFPNPDPSSNPDQSNEVSNQK